MPLFIAEALFTITAVNSQIICILLWNLQREIFEEPYPSKSYISFQTAS